jgi:hydroxymethylbilane synthase
MGGKQKIRLGTRGSPLALRQTQLIAQALGAAYPDVPVEIRVIRTEGDRVADRPLSQFGDKGVFVRAIEHVLLDGEVDLAVHSLKDVPSDHTVSGLVLAAFSPRADPRDALVSRDGQLLAELPSGSTVGTSSPRRRMQLLAARPDLVARDIRGNVDTRLRKVRAGEYDAVVLAAAGLERLGLQYEISEYLPIPEWLPDAGQGIMVVQGRVDDPATRLAAAIDFQASRQAAAAERAVARALDADCHSPIGALAQIDGDTLSLNAVAARDDLGGLTRDHAEGPLDRAEAIGLAVGKRLAESLGSVAGYTQP